MGARALSASRLLSVPNVSEGRHGATIAAIAAAFGSGLRDVHSDPDHHRSVFTLTGEPGGLAGAVLAGAREAVSRIELSRNDGIHPRIGVLDVAPIVYLEEAHRGAACAEALVLADLLGDELALPVFLYGILAQGRTRAQLRRGGPYELSARISAGELRPDFGPRAMHPTAGAVLVAARPPLVAFNLELAPPANAAAARAVAGRIRETGPQGLPGVRAIGLWLEHKGCAQVSVNVEDHLATPLSVIVQAVAAHARVSGLELVGLAPRAAFEGFSPHVPVRGLRLLEDVLEG